MNISIENLISLISAGSSAVVAIISIIIAAVRNHKLNRFLDQAKQRETYTVCPHCKKKLPLSQLGWFLPTGEIDNNLDGKPDYQD